MASVYERPYLYPKQERAIFSNKRWRLCEASTKSGKTVASIAQMLEWGFGGTAGQNYWWVAPISDQARIAFNRVKQNLTPGSFTARESPVPSINLITGPTLSFKSSDNPDSLYGEDVYGAIIDEASRCRPEAWYAVRSTLTATRGPCVMIGNVKGRKNWFWDFCRRAENDEEPNASFERITWRDAVDAGVLDLEEIEDARRNLPEIVFRELYEAVASDDTGNPFGEDHIIACIGELAESTPVAFGIDLAKKQDYLVVLGLDALGRTCRFHRWNGVPWRNSIQEIHRIVGEDIPALVDSTGIGDPVLEELQEGHGNFEGYHFTAVSKQRLMEGLAVSIQGHEITFPDGPIKNELMSFEYALTRTGVRYAAAEGFNDDCVCALALARQQWSTTAPGANLMEHMARQAHERRKQIEIENSGVDTVGQQFVRELQRGNVSQDQIFENELTALYKKTLDEHLSPINKICAGCHEPITGNSRVSDGQFSWHNECAGLGVRIAA